MIEVQRYKQNTKALSLSGNKRFCDTQTTD